MLLQGIAESLREMRMEGEQEDAEVVAAQVLLRDGNRCVELNVKGQSCSFYGWPLCSTHRRRHMNAVSDRLVIEREELLERAAAEQDELLARLQASTDVHAMTTYVARQDDHIKIGRTSRNVSERMRSLDTAPNGRPPGLPVSPVVLVTEFDGDCERYLHLRWREQRRGGEWFQVDSKMEEWLAALAKGSDFY